MLEYSYKVSLLKLQSDIKALQIQLLSKPDDERIKRRLDEKLKESRWFEERIKEGKDLGVRII